MDLRFLLIAPVALVAGCTTIGSSLDLPLADCSSAAASASTPCVHETDLLFLPKGNQDKKAASVEMVNHSPEDVTRALVERFKDEPWAKDGDRPFIGIGLSGGGSKAAPFAMGVLKRFVEEGWLEETDLISSVSGGGYAAYYLYSHASLRNEALRSGQTDALMEKKTPSSAESLPDLESFFVDARRISIAENRTGKPDRDRKPHYPRCEVWSEDASRLGYAYDEDSKIVDAPSSSADKPNKKCAWKRIPDAPRPAPLVDFGCRTFTQDARRHQHFVSCYQDVLSPKPGGFSNNEDKAPYSAYARAAGLTIATWPAHHFANSLFDWKLGLTPSRRIYRDGIARTYGQVPVGSDPAALMSKDEFTFDKLRGLYENCAEPCLKLPWWVMNATNAAHGDNRHDIRRSIFEITPASFGSGQYGYVHGVAIDRLSPTLRVIDGVGAAGAFFDSLASKQPGNVPDLAIFAALHALNLRWGYEVANYNSSDNGRIFHSALPWPGYYLDKFWRHSDSRYIRLADGGMSGENNGVYSLLRRGTQHIVVVDGAVDLHEDRTSDADSRDNRYASMSDLCKLGKALSEYGLDIEFSRLPDGAPVATSTGAYRLHSGTSALPLCMPEKDEYAIRSEYRWNFNPFRWKRQIWHGRVVKVESEAQHPRPSDILVGTQLYYIKSAVDSADVMQAKNDWVYDPDVCVDRPGSPNTPMGLPCTLVGYFIDNAVTKKDGSSTLWNPCEWKFPMTQTVGITANSSSNHYNAQRDLGWYLAGQLACLEGSPFYESERCERVSPDPEYREPKRLPLLPQTLARLDHCRA